MNKNKKKIEQINARAIITPSEESAIKRALKNPREIAKRRMTRDIAELLFNMLEDLPIEFEEKRTSRGIEYTFRGILIDREELIKYQSLKPPTLEELEEEYFSSPSEWENVHSNC